MNENENYFSKIYWRLILFSFHSRKIQPLAACVSIAKIWSHRCSLALHVTADYKKLNEIKKTKTEINLRTKISLVVNSLNVHDKTT